MLDQSFSYENFRLILDIENRKGNYIEEINFFKTSDVFEKSRGLSERIIDKNKEIRAESLKLRGLSSKSAVGFEKLNKLKNEKEVLKSERESKLEQILLDISKNTDKENYKLQILKGQLKFGAQLYEIKSCPEDFFISKQLQRNIHKTFKVKQESRKNIISQLRHLIDDGFPKIVIRTDIKSFYESVPHDQLLAKIEENSLLSYPSKNIIRDVLNQYWSILLEEGIKNVEDERIGIPRGIGFSAYLAELFLRSFDKKMTSYPNVTYYKRYVDDIIIIITPQSRNEVKSVGFYKKEVGGLLSKSTGLSLNLSKTSCIDLRKASNKRKASKTYFITYLGYKFVFGYKKEIDKNGRPKVVRFPLIMLMSDEKLNRYKLKIELAFQDYKTHLHKYLGRENGLNKLLLQRIKFITANFQLQSRKSNVFIGVYFSNEFLNGSFEDLTNLDKKLEFEINLLPESTKSQMMLKFKLKELSFEKGFKEKRIVQFNVNSFKNNKILKIWSNL